MNYSTKSLNISIKIEIFFGKLVSSLKYNTNEKAKKAKNGRENS